MDRTYQERITDAAKRLGIKNEYLTTDAVGLMTDSTHMSPVDSLRMVLVSGATSEAVSEFYRHIDVAELINMVTACNLFTHHFRGQALEVLAGLPAEKMDEYHQAIREALRSELGSVSLSTPNWMFDLLAGHMTANDITLSNDQ